MPDLIRVVSAVDSPKLDKLAVLNCGCNSMGYELRCGAEEMNMVTGLSLRMGRNQEMQTG